MKKITFFLIIFVTIPLWCMEKKKDYDPNFGTLFLTCCKNENKATKQNIATMETLLNKGFVDINRPYNTEFKYDFKNLPHHGTPAIYVACSYKQPEIMQFLLKHGANINVKNGIYSDTLLYLIKDPSLLKIILDHAREKNLLKTMLNEKIYEIPSPLWNDLDKPNKVEMLLTYGSDYTLTMKGDTLLHELLGKWYITKAYLQSYQCIKINFAHVIDELSRIQNSQEDYPLDTAIQVFNNISLYHEEESPTVLGYICDLINRKAPCKKKSLEMLFYYAINNKDLNLMRFLNEHHIFLGDMRTWHTKNKKLYAIHVFGLKRDFFLPYLKNLLSLQDPIFEEFITDTFSENRQEEYTEELKTLYEFGAPFPKHHNYPALNALKTKSDYINYFKKVVEKKPKGISNTTLLKIRRVFYQNPAITLEAIYCLVYDKNFIRESNFPQHMKNYDIYKMAEALYGSKNKTSSYFYGQETMSGVVKNQPLLPKHYILLFNYFASKKLKDSIIKRIAEFRPSKNICALKTLQNYAMQNNLCKKNNAQFADAIFKFA